MNNLRRIFRYLRKPYYIEYKAEMDTSLFLKFLLFFVVFAIYMAICTIFLGDTYKEDNIYLTHSVTNDIEMLPMYFLLAIFIMPVINGLIFRLPLSLKKGQILCACFLQFCLLVLVNISFVADKGNQSNTSLLLILIPLLVPFVFMLIMFLLRIFRKDILTRNFHILFYAFPIISFATGSFIALASRGATIFDVKVNLFASIILISQISLFDTNFGILSVFLRTRYKNGLQISILFHILSTAIIIATQYAVPILFF